MADPCGTQDLGGPRLPAAGRCGERGAATERAAALGLRRVRLRQDNRRPPAARRHGTRALGSQSGTQRAGSPPPHPLPSRDRLTGSWRATTH
eukprot:scaffold182_cov350-Prasinococcus_capsulatus_cf.AAC.13